MSVPAGSDLEEALTLMDQHIARNFGKEAVVSNLKVYRRGIRE